MWCLRGDAICLQELLVAAPLWAEQVYVGKRGGTASIKQPQIDELLVKLCKQVGSTVSHVVLSGVAMHSVSLDNVVNCCSEVFCALWCSQQVLHLVPRS
jgi:hypothetical protein